MVAPETEKMTENIGGKVFMRHIRWQHKKMIKYVHFFNYGISNIGYSVSCNTSLDYWLVHKILVPAKNVHYDRRGMHNHKEQLRNPLCSPLEPNTSLHINKILLQHWHSLEKLYTCNLFLWLISITILLVHCVVVGESIKNANILFVSLQYKQLQAMQYTASELPCKAHLSVQPGRGATASKK
jgi:hypothetical protein